MSETWRQRRDKAAREYMHSYRGTAAEGNTDALSGFVHGYNQCRADLLEELKELIKAGQEWLDSRPYHDCIDDGKPECEQCLFATVLTNWRKKTESTK